MNIWHTASRTRTCGPGWISGHRDEPYIHHRPSDTFRHHALLGWTSAPNLSRRIWGYDGAFTVETNAEGFRDSDRSGPPNRPSILVLGDSFVWGLFLDNDELMPQRLQHELAQAGYEVEVSNFGMAGYGTDQELLVLREYGPRLAPELVVLAFFYSNDFEDNARPTSRWRGGRAKPFFRPRCSRQARVAQRAGARPLSPA